MDEREAMRRALDLAWRGWGRVHPNPLVGAVVLKDGAVVGEGWHAEFGALHAEAAALAQAGEQARGATVVVTLEPCAHRGKQPPCVDALVRAGVRRVVAALRDPNPVAAGGMAQLRAAGVEVQVGLLGAEAAAQNAAFLSACREPARPFVVLKLATSVDFRIADAEGRSRWISGPEAREYVHWLRAGFDGIGVGLGTARADDPSLTVRGEVVPRVAPIRFVFDRGLELSLDSTVVRTAREVPVVLVGSPAAPAERARLLEARGVRVILADGPAAALRALRTDGVGSLLVEGGAGTAGWLLQAGLVDRFVWIQAPLWLGDRGVPAIRGVPDVELEGAPRWHPVERRALGEDSLLVLDRQPCLPAS
jgi:diaminohydroxyphosphoribosylaminopyrimidine deaminase/5-amino-6-(5-phosphoribosylamino)uracil reductase